MSETQFPPRGRITKKFTDIGPYFRVGKSDDENFFFDCLAVCVGINAEPDKREFYGWWLELKKTDTGFSYHYQYGFFDVTGEWQEKAIPKKHQAEVTRSLQVFYEKMMDLVENTFELDLEPSSALDSHLVLTAA
ncbi:MULTISPECIES: sigma factor-binding protein Crl [unclassified Motilimonas]|uniref:sigma factor-binding protein Crl n=1 Tax=Motilimonas TaxID=1914248 RepID=UPI001E6107CC|nr:MULTISPECIES: sigma factor-binding protein Crl [unclassified Motilimonas]MCE0556026.1 sigma factor-binding protein Crl [Motilimonas sp. E26]MDO6526479.1 sigma factor-binding protein Crl [Motilimonas sp. 1_MG-2023]